ncbi:unnamed protein product [Adineta ricciae]|uniref:Endonuclease/exonuclease/phosphatase domain-containing protein n=1 Tax=Adineta ricciae TaxID=249248 RepID=A0A815WF59_ADIRI|nr:unnamed protein product [Adineta ricciae]
MVLLIYDSVSVFVPNSACSCRPTITGESNFAINKTILILMCPTKSYPLLPRSVGCKRRSRRPKWALLANIPCESEPMIRQSPAFEKAAASRSKPKNSKNQKILHKTITISTYNVRTLKQTGKLHQLIYGCNQNNIDLVAVQEHRWQTSEQTNRTYQTLNDKYWRFEYCSATPEGHGGIGLLMNPRMGNPAMTVIVTYAPTEDKNEREKIPSTTTYKDWDPIAIQQIHEQLASTLTTNLLTTTATDSSTIAKPVTCAQHKPASRNHNQDHGPGYIQMANPKLNLIISSSMENG